MSKLLTSGFWFSYSVNLMPWIFNTLLIIFGLFIVLAIVLKVILRYQKDIRPWLSRTMRKSVKMFSYMGVIGWALLFFSYESAPYLSSRIFYLLWALGVAVWVVYIAVHVRNRMAQDQNTGQQMFNVDKYMPGKG